MSEGFDGKALSYRSFPDSAFAAHYRDDLHATPMATSAGGYMATLRFGAMVMRNILPHGDMASSEPTGFRLPPNPGRTIKARRKPSQSSRPSGFAVNSNGFGGGQGRRLRCGAYMRLWSLSALRNLRDCRSRRSKDDPTLAYIDPRLGICGRGQGQALYEILSETPDPADTGAELGVKRRPADIRVPAQGVEFYMRARCRRR